MEREQKNLIFLLAAFFKIPFCIRIFHLIVAGRSVSKVYHISILFSNNLNCMNKKSIVSVTGCAIDISKLFKLEKNIDLNESYYYFK